MNRRPDAAERLLETAERLKEEAEAAKTSGGERQAAAHSQMCIRDRLYAAPSIEKKEEKFDRKGTPVLVTRHTVNLGNGKINYHLSLIHI